MTIPAADEPHLKFRPDIDGLRALAIGAVLLFHFDLLGASGGFAGVDMFFVVSGYLMTGMLARAAPSRAAVIAFYRRRFWRIVPAYYVAIAATLAVGAIVMLPPDAERLGMSAVAAVAFVPNFFFSAGVGYFDTAAIYKPLLHTWSLGVEAQFYLIWPFVVVALTRRRRGTRIAIYAAIVVASVAFCQAFSIGDPKVAFFSLPARLWQFGLGALAIEGQSLRPLSGRRSAAALRIAACIAIVATPWLVSENDLWPAPFALPICVATAVLLWLGDDQYAVTTRLLASAPLAFIGRISYSLYLVHWPLIVFAGYDTFPQPPLVLRVVLLAFCIPLAMALYHGVEAPMRLYGRSASLPRSRAVLLGLVPALTLLCGYALHREPDRFLTWPSTAETPAWPSIACTPWQRPTSLGRYCTIGAAATAPRALLWGDSHAEQWMPGFAALFTGSDQAIAVAVKDACPPIVGVLRVSNRFQRPRDCLDNNQAALATILGAASIQTVVIAARWAYYEETTRFGNEKGSPSYLITAGSTDLSVAQSRQLFADGLDNEVGQLLAAGKHVVLIAQVPEMGFDAWRCIAMKGSALCDIARALVTERQAGADAVLDRLAQRPGVMLVDPKDILCDAALCHATLDGVPAYRDDNHVSGAASQQIVEHLFANFKQP
ncbi:MAG TPA: acyltransferase family protein [Beijerinckiaceae bacterium]|nr:acyltransferase family protein [Beijerinckiaceae bacterium]